jgi:hypothetical protein
MTTFRATDLVGLSRADLEHLAAEQAAVLDVIRTAADALGTRGLPRRRAAGCVMPGRSRPRTAAAVVSVHVAGPAGIRAAVVSTVSLRRSSTMPRKTTPASRLACARHAVTDLLTWDHPGEPVDWQPTEQQIEERTTQLYSWVALEPGEATAALAQILAEDAERARQRAIAAP